MTSPTYLGVYDTPKARGHDDEVVAKSQFKPDPT
jgi:hypothetical protein